MKPARFVVAALLSCITVAPAVAQSEQDRDTKKNAKAQQAEQRRQARFRGMDTNRDGVITRQEWRGNNQSFKQHDTNRDGVLSGNEIWTRSDDEDDDWRARADRENVLVQTFRRNDANRDGILSRSEWASDSNSFNRVDVNRDGVVTEREFLGEGWQQEPVEAGDDRTVRRDTRAYQSGYDRGLLDGRQAGREDKELRNTWDLEGQRELEQADAGYAANVGSREDYQAGYRAGFRAGYRQGFGPRVP